MSVARILSRTELGLAAPLVEVEAHIAAGLPAFTIVGLPTPVVRESRERVRAALQSSGFEFPQRRITVNLAPVELAKQGGRFDLPVALALLVASGQVAPMRADEPMECYGELGLNGELRPVVGLFLAALHATRAGHAMLVPRGSAAEVQLAGPDRAYAAASLREAVQLLNQPCRAAARLAPATFAAGEAATDLRLSEVVGHAHAKRALLIAASGGHSVLLIGPPGSGKSMLAARLPGLLPALSRSEAFEVAGIRALAGLACEPDRFTERPFRAPHHTSSAQAIVGGGAVLRPGEISLAHQGVLFLDELPEFDRRVLEALREPLENGRIALSRAARHVTLPARFQLVAAMNPCACGYLGDSREACRCSPARLQRYRQRLSGPLLDRIDIRVHVLRLSREELMRAATLAAGGTRDSPAPGELQDEDLRAAVRAAREYRLSRSGVVSAALSPGQLRGCCRLSSDAARLMSRSAERWSLSGRGAQRLMALSRTIADLEGSELIQTPHLAEALQLRRPLDQ